MANYKVLQDIEAEDKLLGPLTGRQFFYGVFSGLWIFLGYLVAGRTSWWVLVIFIIPVLPMVFMAIPLGRDQPNDIWLMAKINYHLRPRVRVWQQSGSAPKVIIKPNQSKSEKPAGLSNQKQTGDVQTRHHLADLLNQNQAESVNSPDDLNQPVFDPFLTEDHPIANRFDRLLNNQSQQRRLDNVSGPAPGSGPASPNQPLQASGIIKSLAETDDLSLDTIAGLASRQPESQPESPDRT